MNLIKFLPLAVIVLIVSIVTLPTNARVRERGAWISGNSTSAVPVPSNYVDQGMASTRSYPGSRANAQAAYDEARREWHFYGGSGYGASDISILLNDLWTFRLNDSRWVWHGGNGSAQYQPTYGPIRTPGTNFSPGSRSTAVAWFDHLTREFFLYGGSTGLGNVNSDVWRYRMNDSTWTWMSGTTSSGAPAVPGPLGVYGASYTPGGRYQGCSVYDPIRREGYFFGGVDSLNGLYFSLWKIRFNDSFWALVSGNTTAGVGPTTTGKGIASPTFNPASRVRPSCAMDYVRGEIYIFGGRGIQLEGGIRFLQDLWRFRLNDSSWTWLAGELSGNLPGNYGTKGAGVAGVTVPASRAEATAWFDSAARQFGIHGGTDNPSTPNAFADSWIYDVDSGVWTWFSGPQGPINHAGTYPGLNGAIVEYDLPARVAAHSAFDQNTQQRMLFGGLMPGALRNDLWLFQKYGTNCSLLIDGLTNATCRRYIDENSAVLRLAVPIVVLPQNESQCLLAGYPEVEISSCGSVECVKPSACSPLANASDFLRKEDLCFLDYSAGSCPSGSVCDTNGTCKVLLGQTCSAATQCNSTFCEAPGVCCASPCNSSQLCDSTGQCKQKVGLGCNVDSDCISGSCGSNGLCCASACDPGNACDASGQCYSRFGQNCTSQSECFEGVCSQAGLCCAQNCPVGLICIGAGGCLRFNGFSCAFDSDCVSGICTSSGYCCSQECSGSEGCANDGICKTLAGGQCSNSSTCLSGFCGLNLRCCLADNCSCNDQGQCLQPLGASCASNSQCLSGFCSASGHCCSSACSGNCEDCISGTCNPILNGFSARCPSINCTTLVAGWQGNNSNTCHRFNGVLQGYCDAGSCNTSTLRCNTEASIVPISGASCVSTECKSECTIFEQVALFSSPRSVCSIGQTCGSGTRLCSQTGECAVAVNAGPSGNGDNNVGAPVVLGGVNPAVVLGSIIGAVVVLVAIIIAACLIARKRRQRQLEFELTEEMKAGFNIKPSELSVSKKLGEGSYGVVYLGSYKGKKVAVKRLAMTMFANAIADFFREAMLIMSVKQHPNVIQTFGMCQEQSNLSLVMEYLPGGSLLDIIEDESVEITESEMWKYARGIAAGMESLSSQQIVHRDLACRNILLDEDQNPKVADFGYARVVNQASGSGKTSATVGPIRWMAPEAIGEQIYSEATDVWAYGCVLLELVTRDEPFAGMPMVDVAVNVRDTKRHATIPSSAPEWIRDLMEQCWRPEPKDRPSFSQIGEFLEQHKPGKTQKKQRKSSETSSS